MFSSLCHSLFYVLFIVRQICLLCTHGNISARNSCRFDCIVERKDSKWLPRSRVFHLSSYIKIKEDARVMWLLQLVYRLFAFFTVWGTLSHLFWFLGASKLRTAIQHLFLLQTHSLEYNLFSYCFYLWSTFLPLEAASPSIHKSNTKQYVVLTKLHRVYVVFCLICYAQYFGIPVWD